MQQHTLPFCLCFLGLYLDFVSLFAGNLPLNKTVHTRFAIVLLLLVSSLVASAQYKVKGTVYDSTRQYGIQAVTVMSSSGSITMTDSMGRYQINVKETDSVWFSYLGKPTIKYAVLKMPDVTQFDIALEIQSVVMDEVRVQNRSYKMDSIQNRIDYAKVFNYKKVSLGSLTSVGPTGAGFDVAELIRLFQFRKNKSMLSFQQRLLEQEREKYVDHRFNKGVVKELTGLDGERLDQFMIQYRPTYEFTVQSSEYDFKLYIKTSGEQFQKSF